uniref:B30.2/SPRY domain-containing protein n=1 Tax=Globodera pallida TaxID=36090 RepID=A0A183BTG2_GLOPA
MYALSEGKANIVRFLLSRGACFGRTTADARTAGCGDGAVEERAATSGGGQNTQRQQGAQQSSFSGQTESRTDSELATQLELFINSRQRSSAVRECCERERVIAQLELEDLRQFSDEQRDTIRKLEQQLEKLRSNSKNDEEKKAEMAEHKDAVLCIASPKMHGLTPQNRWDSAACHEALMLFGNDQLIVQHFDEGKRFAFCSVFAESPIPITDNGIFYYEVKILEKNGELSIGLATKQMPLHKCVGLYDGTYAYASTGRFLGYAVECRRCHWHERPIIEGKPWLDVGDVVGCGVDLANRKIIYTINGRRLDTANLVVTSAEYLFPCVSLWYPGTIIEANFEPIFKFNI